ncbi:MAG: amino acid ABC transporter permease [Synergistaceae bacterium]
MVFDFRYVLNSLSVAVRYLHVTLLLSVIPLIIGIIFGTLIAVCRKYRIKVVATVLDIMIPVMKGIPLVLYIFILNFLILKPLDVLSVKYQWADSLRFIDKIYIGMFTMSIYAIVIVSETIRSALISVDDGQYEAAYSIGLTRFQSLKNIIIPQALPFAVPVLSNNFIGLIKGSSVVYLITIVDVMNGALSSAQINYRFLEAYIAAALIYWVLCLIVERSSILLEVHIKKFKIVDA